MDQETIIVTGSCGRIGSRVVQRLVRDNYRVIGLELPKAQCEPNTIPIDLSSNESVERAFAKIPHRRIASVIHLAAYYSFDQKHSDLYEKITVQGTERLLKALQSFEVDQFLFSSTILVHAPTQPGYPITEDAPFKLTWGYPLSKVRTEQLIHKLRGKMATLILRIAGVYDDHCYSIPISRQIQRIYERRFEAHLFSGNVHHGASFVHMEDLIDAIELAVKRRKALPPELTLLIGEPKTLSYDELQRAISYLIRGKVFKTWRIPKFLAKFGAWAQGLIGNPFIKPWMVDLADDHYELDISRAQKFLGWVPKHRLEETLPKMIGELKTDPDAWYKTNQL